MGRERRFFVPDLGASSVEITDEEAHHLTHVLRLGEGDAVALFDGKGHAANATVARIDGGVVELEVRDRLLANESPLALTLAVAVPKGDTMSLIVQKLTELGVATIQPLLSDNSEMPGDAVMKRIERWQRVSLEAAKQCGRSQLPCIENPQILRSPRTSRHDGSDTRRSPTGIVGETLREPSRAGWPRRWLVGTRAPSRQKS